MSAGSGARGRGAADPGPTVPPMAVVEERPQEPSAPDPAEGGADPGPRRRRRTLRAPTLAEHREVTQERIFEALSGLMYEQGYDAVGLAQVAEAAGLSRTTIYNYFPDKDSLLVAYAARETRRYVDELLGDLDEVDDPVERLRVYIRHQFGYFATRHLPPGVALRLVLPDRSYHQVLEHVSVLEDTLRSILTEGLEEGYLAIDDVESMMPLVTACTNRGGIGDLDPDDLDDELEVTETFVLRALGVRLLPDGRPQRATPARRPR